MKHKTNAFKRSIVTRTSPPPDSVKYPIVLGGEVNNNNFILFSSKKMIGITNNSHNGIERKLGFEIQSIYFPFLENDSFHLIVFHF